MRGMYIVMVCALCVASDSPATNLEEFSRSVVLLRHQQVEAFTDWRGTFEVWLKVSTNAWIPKLNPISGTGFLASHSNSLYLITARHVATTLGFGAEDSVSM